MKTYPEILKEVKEKNTTMSHHDAQKTASTIFRELKEEEAKKDSGPKDPPKTESKKADDLALSNKIEAEIRGDKHLYDKNKIIGVGRRYGDFKFVEDGKDGVNTLVFLQGPVRVPAKGHFKIFK